MNPISAAMLVALGVAGSLNAQVWERINPPGWIGAVRGMAVDGSGVLTITGSGGTFYSEDQGRSWRGGDWDQAPIRFHYNGKEVSHPVLTSFTAGPGDDLFVLVAGVADKEMVHCLFTSSDHGFTWRNTMDTLPFRPPFGIMELLSAPNGRLYLFLGSGNRNKDLLFVSKDAGKTWEAGAKLPHYLRCATDPDGILYCLSPKGNATILYRSKDDGSSWDSLFAEEGPNIVSLAANRRGSVAILHANHVSAMMPGETRFKTTEFPLPIYAPAYIDTLTVMAITPREEVLVGKGHIGIQKVEKDWRSYSMLNEGLRGDTSASPGPFLDDAQGNIYLRTYLNVYVLRNPETGLRPPSLAPTRAMAKREYDAAGRLRSGGSGTVFPFSWIPNGLVSRRRR